MRDDGEGIVFLGGKDYLPLFCRLTTTLKGRKTVFFNSANRPDLPAGFTATAVSHHHSNQFALRVCAPSRRWRHQRAALVGSRGVVTVRIVARRHMLQSPR